MKANHATHLFGVRNTSNLAPRTTTAAILNLTGKNAVLFLRIGGTLVLVRLLTPDDFGVVALVTPLIAFFSITSGIGFTAGTLQHRDMSRGQASLLFWVSSIAGLGLTILFALAAPLVGSLFSDSRATDVALVASLTFLLTGIGAQHEALLVRALRFRDLLFADITSAVIGTVCGIVAALSGWGYWAIVLRFLVEVLTRVVIICWSTMWLPGRPTWGHESKSLIRYGANVTGFRLLNFFARNLDHILIGWRLGAHSLGLYSLSYRILMTPLQQINTPIQQVLIPALSTLAKEPEKFARWYLFFLRTNTFLAAPLLVAVGLSANEFVAVVFGPGWEGAAPIVRWLTFVGAMQVPYTSLGWLCLPLGRSDRHFQWALIATPLVVLAIIIGLNWGAEGVAASYMVISLFLIVPGFMFILPVAPVSGSAVAGALLPALVAIVGVVTTVVLLIPLFLFTTSPVLVLMSNILGSVIVMAIVGLLFADSQDIRLAVDLLRRIRRRGHTKEDI